MGELGRKFRQHMLVCGYAEATRESYEQAMVALVRAYGGTPPDQLSCDQVQAFIANLVGGKKRAWSTVNVYVSAFRCFYQDVLGRKQDQFSLPPRGRGRIRPRVLDRETVRRILEAHTNLKHRALLEMTYGSGLRVSEVCRLKSCHIESAPDRMMVRVEQGKGRKDRYTLLSQRALDVLRAYWKESQPGEWLFPGLWRQAHFSVEGARHVYLGACEKVGLPRDRAHGNVEKTKTIPVGDFIGRFLLHVLPSGFQKVRAYGWLAPRNKQPALSAIRQALDAQPPPPPPEDETAPERILRLTGIDVTCCPVCRKGRLVCVAEIHRARDGPA